MALQPAQVQPRALVGGVDGQRQGLDGGEVQVGQPLHRVLLLIHPLDVGAVGAIAQAEREGAERRQPVGRSIDRGDRQRRGGRAEHVRDPAAQQVPHPEADERLLAGHGQGPGDDAGVDDVVGRRGGAERDRVGAQVPRPGVAGDDPEGEVGGRHGDRQGRHVEDRPVPGIPGAEGVEGGLAPCRDHGDQRRARSIEDHQRGEVRREGERHRQRLGVQRRRHRHRHLEDRGEDGEHQQRPERGRMREVQAGERGGGQPGHRRPRRPARRRRATRGSDCIRQGRSARRDAKALVQGIGTRRAGEKSRVGRRCTPRPACSHGCHPALL